VRNGLLYLSGLVALIALVGAAVTSAWNYNGSLTNDRKAKLTGTVDLWMVGAKSEGPVTLLNRGERNIFVTSIVFECRFQKWARPVNKLLTSGEIANIEFVRLPKESHDYRCITTLDNDLGIEASFVGDIITGKQLMKNQQYLWFTKDHPELTGHFDLLRTHAVIAGQATLHFRPYGTFEETSITMPCTVLIIQRANADGQYPPLNEPALLPTHAPSVSQEVP
jgi:hypothetical protein